MILSSAEQEKVVHAIGMAENQTSGEIRVVVEKRCEQEAWDRALYYFKKLNMHKTALRNGVLIYLAFEDHKFCIMGDQGIDKFVAANFWEDTKELMLTEFRRSEIAEGLVRGVAHAGQQLAKFFPKGHDDINELPDDIVIGDH